MNPSQWVAIIIIELVYVSHSPASTSSSSQDPNLSLSLGTVCSPCFHCTIFVPPHCSFRPFVSKISSPVSLPQKLLYVRFFVFHAQYSVYPGLMCNKNLNEKRESSNCFQLVNRPNNHAYDCVGRCICCSLHSNLLVALMIQ